MNVLDKTLHLLPLVPLNRFSLFLRTNGLDDIVAGVRETEVVFEFKAAGERLVFNGCVCV